MFFYRKYRPIFEQTILFMCDLRCCRHSDLPGLIASIRAWAYNMPIDHLIERHFDTSLQHAHLAPHVYVPSLMQHVGDISTYAVGSQTVSASVMKSQRIAAKHLRAACQVTHLRPSLVVAVV